MQTNSTKLGEQQNSGKGKRYKETVVKLQL